MQNAPDVEQARPSQCSRCQASARTSDGRLQLHGHGLRRRTLWGRPGVGSDPVFWEVTLRRYRCTECSKAVTVAPRGIWARFRYALGTIAMALAWWGVQLMHQRLVRVRCSPCSIVGDAAPERWRSLPRWTRRSRELFRLDADLPTGDAERADASRAAYLLIARGPPGVEELERAFVGAHG